MKKLKFIKGDYILIILVTIISLVYGYHKIIGYGPYSVHQWRQSDCLSFTLNYYRENLNFFQSSMNWIGKDGHGRTVSEFPIIYYTVAQLWKVFGQHEWIFRLLNLLIVYIGLFYLFKFFKQYLLNDFWAIFGVTLLFSSPVLAYYSNNFIADAPAFGLSLIACFYYWKYYSSGFIRKLYLACLFFLLAGLIKVTSLSVFIILVLFHIYFVFTEKEKKKNLLALIPFAIVLAGVFAWYYYAQYYKIKGIFLLGIWPIWDLSPEKMKEIAKLFYHEMLPSYFNLAGLYFILILFVYNVWNFRNANKFLLVLNIMAFFEVILYILLFFQAFNVHDYYLTNMLIFIPITLLTFLDLINNTHPDILTSKKVKIFAVLCLSLIIYSTALKTRIKYSSADFLVRNTLKVFKRSTPYWDWYHAHYAETYKSLETITLYLRKLGIKRTDKVISIPDVSINTTLYLMDQKGFTDFGYGEFTGEERMKKFIALGARYLITNTRSVEEQEFLKPYLKNKIGSYHNVNIYKLEGS